MPRQPLSSWLFLTLAVGATTAAAAGAGNGTSAGGFVDMLVTARSAALGGAGAATSEGAEAPQGNPAGLGLLERQEVQSGYGSLYSSLQCGTLSYASPMPKKMSFALMGGYFTTGGIPRNLASNRGLFTQQDGEFQVSGRSISVNFAQASTDWFSWGGAFKSLGQTLDAASATAMTFDGGVLLSLPAGVRLGASYLNVGGKMKFLEDGEPDKVLKTLHTGASLSLFPAKALTLMVDQATPNEGKSSLTYGAEFNLSLAHNEEEQEAVNLLGLSARAGYRPRIGDDLGQSESVTWGVGVHAGRFTIDYAFSPFGTLGDTHRVTFTMRFISLQREKAENEDHWEESEQLSF